jgi:hypothetical protein
MTLSSLLLAVLALAAVEGPSLQLEAVDGRRWVGRLASFDGERATLETDAGSLELAPGELLLASAREGSGLPRGRDVVLLASPEGAPSACLAGRLVGGDEYGFTIQIDDGFQVTLPYEHVERLLPAVDRPLDLLASLEGAGFDDRVWRRRDDGGLDGVAGVLVEVDSERLVFEGGLGELEFALEEILAVVLAEPEPPVEAPDGWPCRVALAGGSSFGAALRSVSAGRARLGTAFAGELDLPLAAIDTLLLSPRGDREPQLLSASLPVEVEEYSPLAPDEPVLFPWRSGWSVAGAPLALRGVLASSGIGVHAYGRLVFEVPSGASVLRATVGLTDDVLRLPAEGSVGVAIRVDGVERARLAPFGIQEGPRPVRVEGLVPGQRVELVVDDGGDDEAGDRAAWADAVWLP